MTMAVISPASSATVVLDGEIDIATGPAIRRSLIAAIRGGNAHLAVDMSGVAFIDAAGIGVLVDAAKRARRAGGGLSLLAPSWPVQRLLDLFHLDEILPAAPRSGGRFVAGSAALTPHGLPEGTAGRRWYRARLAQFRVASAAGGRLGRRVVVVGVLPQSAGDQGLV
jgi:anti-sigma B factor antagonist